MTWFLTTLGTFPGLLLFFNLAPCDHITNSRARGLSGHTSPYGECAFLMSRLLSGTSCLLGWSSTFLLFWTLAPRDYVTYCQAQGLSGHTLPCGECVFFNLEDSVPPVVEEDYFPFSWSDSKWAHLVHNEKFFYFELELLTSF